MFPKSAPCPGWCRLSHTSAAAPAGHLVLCACVRNRVSSRCLSVPLTQQLSLPLSSAPHLLAWADRFLAAAAPVSSCHWHCQGNFSSSSLLTPESQLSGGWQPRCSPLLSSVILRFKWFSAQTDSFQVSRFCRSTCLCQK